YAAAPGRLRGEAHDKPRPSAGVSASKNGFVPNKIRWHLYRRMTEHGTLLQLIRQVRAQRHATDVTYHHDGITRGAPTTVSEDGPDGRSPCEHPQRRGPSKPTKMSRSVEHRGRLASPKIWQRRTT